MEIVIDIPEQMYLNAKAGMLCGSDSLVNAIKNGTPLPKGHGDLVDLKEMVDTFWDGNFMEIFEDDLKRINVVVKADKEVVEE